MKNFNYFSNLKTNLAVSLTPYFLESDVSIETQNVKYFRNEFERSAWKDGILEFQSRNRHIRITTHSTSLKILAG